jgi:hypothetical protein
MAWNQEMDDAFKELLGHDVDRVRLVRRKAENRRARMGGPFDVRAYESESDIDIPSTDEVLRAFKNPRRKTRASTRGNMTVIRKEQPHQPLLSR